MRCVIASPMFKPSLAAWPRALTEVRRPLVSILQPKGPGEKSPSLDPSEPEAASTLVVAAAGGFNPVLAHGMAEAAGGAAVRGVELTGKVAAAHRDAEKLAVRGGVPEEGEGPVSPAGEDVAVPGASVVAAAPASPAARQTSEGTDSTLKSWGGIPPRAQGRISRKLPSCTFIS